MHVNRIMLLLWFQWRRCGGYRILWVLLRWKFLTKMLPVLPVCNQPFYWVISFKLIFLQPNLFNLDFLIKEDLIAKQKISDNTSKILCNPPSHLAHNFHHPEVRVSAGQSGIPRRLHWRLMLRRRIVITKLDDWMSPARRFLINDGGKWRFSDRHHFYVAVCVCVCIFLLLLLAQQIIFIDFFCCLYHAKGNVFSHSAHFPIYSPILCVYESDRQPRSGRLGKLEGGWRGEAGMLWGRLRENNDNQVRSLSVSPLWRSKEKETIFALSRSGSRGGGQGAKENNFPSSHPFVFPSIPRIFPWVSFFSTTTPSPRTLS